ncbi:MAG TPA: cupin domain-containing protein [Chthoniobacter sp.]|nr:cupin domain-containing protein [Chthoniobacter sp.]
MKTRIPILGLSLYLLTAGLTAHSSAQSPEAKPITITQLFKRDNPEDKNKDIIVQRIELAPDSAALPHVHPGMVTGYVVSGTLEFQVAGEPLLTLHTGDTFFEPPGSKHMVARNPDKSEKTVLIAFVVNPKNQAVAQPLEGHAH